MEALKKLELKSCPFCGGVPQAPTKHFRLDDAYVFIHRCPVLGPIDWPFASMQTIVTRWNTRTDTPNDGEGWAGTKNSVVIHSPRTDPQREQLVKALKDARKEVNRQLGTVYTYHNNATVSCNNCGRVWPLGESKSGFTVQHDPELDCGKSYALLMRIDAALTAAGEQL
jgi:hypothetical protein